MAQNDFYQNNLHLAFPLTAGKSDAFLPELLADMEVFVASELGFTHKDQDVSCQLILAATENQAAGLGLPGMVGFAVFDLRYSNLSQHLVAPFYGVPFQRNEMVAVSTTSLTQLLNGETGSYYRESNPLVSGWIVEGRNPLQYAGMLTARGRVEPARITVTGEVAANFGTTTVINEYGADSEPPSVCAHLINEVGETPSPEIDATCSVLTGVVLLTGGYQSRVSQDSLQNSITVESDLGTGELLQPCQEASQYHRESPFSYRCDEVLRRINGQPGDSLLIPDGTGVSVESHPELHRVVIRVGSPDFAACIDDEDNVPTEYLPINDEGLSCGQNGAPFPELLVADDDTGFFQIKDRPELGVSEPVTTTAAAIVTCDWVWNSVDTVWEFTGGGCGSPQGCFPPDDPPGPSLNEQTKTICTKITTQLDLPLLNGDFEQDAPLNHWDTTGGVVLLRESGLFDVSDLPLVQLAPGARIEQRFVKHDPVPYTIQFTSQVSEAGLRVLLVSESGDQLLHEFPAPAGLLQQSDFGPFKISSQTFKVMVENTSTVTAYFGFASLVRQ